MKEKKKKRIGESKRDFSFRALASLQPISSCTPPYAHLFISSSLSSRFRCPSPWACWPSAELTRFPPPPLWVVGAAKDVRLPAAVQQKQDTHTLTHLHYRSISYTLKLACNSLRSCFSFLGIWQSGGKAGGDKQSSGVPLLTIGKLSGGKGGVDGKSPRRSGGFPSSPLGALHPWDGLAAASAER